MESKRETHKTIKIGERHWRIAKFDALTGSFISYKLMTHVLPLIPLLKGGNFNPMLMAEALQGLNRNDFAEIQSDCLKVCCEMQGDAPVPVVTSDGRWAVPGIEQDTMTVLLLTVQTLIFNVMGFFGDGALSEIEKSLSALSPLNAKE